MHSPPNQLVNLGYNHIAIEVADVERSVHFYRDILGLRSILRPPFDFPGAWFDFGNKIELHLIGGEPIRSKSSTRSNHFAIEVTNLDAWHSWLMSHQVPIIGRKVRPDGVPQLYACDPDGYIVELTDLSSLPKA
jgi:catechol 2,3-dioxygenase-like lactoylglutathione lyase family enzyme